MSTRSRREKGTVSIEVVMILPVLVLVAMLVLQLGVAGWTASQTEFAARQAARAQGMGESPTAAASAALPGALRIDSASTGGERVTLRVRVPRVSILPVFTVTRSVAMPDTN